jgi:hypothetical protein
MRKDQIIAKLSRLIEKRKPHNEAECGKILAKPEVATVLLPLGSSMMLIDTELRTSSGDVDLIVCATESLPGGQTCRLLYIWELKAPQHSLFRVETKGRACPTKEFYSAENQLIHYHAHIAGSEEDRKKFKIMSVNDVRIGGIIIGTSRNLVTISKGVSKDKSITLAASARDIRDRTLYRSANLKVMTWDMVIERLQQITASHSRYKKPRRVSITLGAGPDVG